jgi:hypothetical protein
MSEIAKPWPVVLLFVVSVIIWFEWNHHWVQISLPAPSVDPEVRLCDVAVRRFLTSDQIVEMTRNVEIINQLNCDIAKRARDYQ